MALTALFTLLIPCLVLSTKVVNPEAVLLVPLVKLFTAFEFFENLNQDFKSTPLKLGL